jgi:hypothetical protein
MFISATLISIGFALFVYCYNLPSNMDPLPALAIASAAASTTFAGVFTPFGRPILGALIGFFGLFLLGIVAALMHPAM